MKRYFHVLSEGIQKFTFQFRDNYLNISSHTAYFGFGANIYYKTFKDLNLITKVIYLIIFLPLRVSCDFNFRAGSILE